MATRGSFQKRQKETARKEKRQQKIERRQGRLAPPVRSYPDSDTLEGEPGAETDLGAEEADAENAEVGAQPDSQ